MNKKEILKLLDQSFPIPTDNDVQTTIQKIESRMEDKAINRFANAPVKEGYSKALEILRNKQTDFSGINALKFTQARAIAAVAVDYLNGRCSQELLCGVPIRKM